MSASHVQVTASKQKVLLFEQGRHVVLGTDGTQANSPWPSLGKGITRPLFHGTGRLPILGFLTKQKTVQQSV